MCNVNIVKDEPHNIMGKTTIVGAKKLQFHLCNAVTSYSRPVFPQQLTEVAWKSRSKPVCVL